MGGQLVRVWSVMSAVTQFCEFQTRRLRVGPWHVVAEQLAVDLAAIVAGILSEATTRELPEMWRGDFTVERARAWIDERDGESPTLLIVDTRSIEPAGVLILFEASEGGSRVDLRIGYLFAQSLWGQGLATELVAGLVEWARKHPSIQTLSGGVATDNPASARVLVKNGFTRNAGAEGQALYQLSI